MIRSRNGARDGQRNAATRPSSMPYRARPRLALVPGLAVALTVLGLNMLGDVLRDVLDPTVVSKR